MSNDLQTLSETRDRTGPAVACPPTESLLVSALESVANAIFIVDRDARIVWANKAFSLLCGYGPDDLAGKTPSLLNSGIQSKSFYTQLWQTILSGEVWRGVVVDKRKDGSLYTADQTITPLLNEQGLVTHFIAIQQDVTPRSREAEHDHYLAYHDVLTGLPNRAHLVELLEKAMSHAAKENHTLAVLFLDLDRFKPVNDTYGHDVGDLLLRAVAERLQAAVRKSDAVARFGGDEFAILLTGMVDAKMVTAVAAKLVAALARPFLINEHTLHIGVSIGIATFPVDGRTQEELIRTADQAMYLAKQQGGGEYRFSPGPSRS